SAPAARAGIGGSFELMSVASLSSVRREVTASARLSRSCSICFRTASGEFPSAGTNRLLRQLGFLDRLLGHRRRRLLDRPQAEEAEDRGDREDDAGRDQQRRPDRQDELEQRGYGR